MSVSILESCRKRRRGPKVYGFHTFAEPGCPLNPSGCFRDNIRVLLQECAEPEGYAVEGMPTWCTLLLHEKKSFVIPLFIIEENVKQSPHPFCDHCRCAGWSGHLVSKRNYHLIIPSDREWNKPLVDGVFDVQTHLLHGLIHCNGYGHLLCVNGIEGGSKYIFGREIMDLWDRICTNLQARKITVEDASKKRSMDLRLLYGVAYGHPWFGRWGYKFCRGSFGVTEYNYDRALEILSSLELDQIIQDFTDSDQCEKIKQIICYYRDMSEIQLITIQDLLRFMLTVKCCVPAQKAIMDPTSTSSSMLELSTRIGQQKRPPVKEKYIKCKNFSTVAANMDSRWPVRRLEFAAEVIVDTLKEKKANKSGHEGMTRQDVRDAARMHIGDTGLLDYVLKSMNNVIVGSYVVSRAVNPKTRILEYTIHEHGNGVSTPVSEPEILSEPLSVAPALVPGVDVFSDIAYLYENVLLKYPESELVELAAQTVLDSKHFVKECVFWDEQDRLLRFFCKVMPGLVDSDAILSGEIVHVQLHATVVELKRAVEIALRDTYCVLENFVVTDIDELINMEDGQVLFGAVESGSEILVRGCGIDLNPHMRYQGGADNWKVRCECGARDDDGERMVACDICEVWLHTRCCGIEDSDTLPPLFVCPGCCDSLLPPRIKPSLFENGVQLLY